MPQDDNEKEFVGFRVAPSLDSTLEDLAWSNRISKSELLRRFCRYGVDHVDEALAETGEQEDESQPTNR